MADFKIAAAQFPSIRGDVAANIATHAATIAAAAKHGVRVLVFPELSLTGYEPDLAVELAITGIDKRLMANHAQSVGTYSSVGKSAVWLPDGALLAQAEGAESCLVIAAKSQAPWLGEVMRI